MKDFHPLGFALAPCLLLAAANLHQTPWSSIALPLLGSAFVGLLVLGFCRWRAGPGPFAGLAATSILVPLFFYGHLHAAIYDYVLAPITRQAYLAALNKSLSYSLILHFPLGFVLFFGWMIGLKWLSKRPGLHEPLRGFANFVAGFLVLSAALQGISAVALGQTSLGRSRGLPEVEVPQPPPKDLPDIYFIVLDGFARRDFLKSEYQADLPEWYQALEDLGFRVLPQSQSNYGWTFLSLTSTLNYEHLEGFCKEVGPESKDLSRAYGKIQGSRVLAFLKKLGYRFAHVSSTWGATLKNPYADKELSAGKSLFSDEFTRVFLRTTALKVLDFFAVDDLATFQAAVFDEIPKAARFEGPTFTMAHLILPHHPFLFEADGTVRKNATMMDQFVYGAWKDKDAYVGQLRYTARRILESIQAIVRDSKTPPVIILQSDHGPQIVGEGREKFLTVRHGVLNAIKAPPKVLELMQDDQTLSQTFPRLFDGLFGAKIPVPESKIFTSSFTTPFQLVPLEEALKEARFEDAANPELGSKTPEESSE